MKTQILIVGAGPTGLVLGLFLKKQGIDFRIIDKKSGPGLASRAIIVHARTLEFYRQIGLADDVIQRGIKVHSVNIYDNEKVVASLNLENIGADLSPYPFLLSFPQDDHEKYLTEQLSRLGVEIEWNTELVKVENSDTGVKVHLHKIDESEEICYFRYLCGCDGAHSFVRQQLQIDFSGGTYEQKFYVADVNVTEKNKNISVNLCFDNNDFNVIMPVRQSGTHRLIGIMPPDGNSFEDIKFSIEKHLGVEISSINWFSTYKVHHRVANHFRIKSSFLLGDASHIHSPTGGQGMNTGIGDAVNLSWKLATVLHKKAHDQILDSYEIERIKFAKRLVNTTDRLFQFIMENSFLKKVWCRFVFLPLFPFLMQYKKGRCFVFRTVSQIQVNYRKKNLLTLIFKKKIQEGDRLPWISYNDSDNFTSLQSLNWQIHIYGSAGNNIHDIAFSKGLELNVFPWNKATQKAGFKKNLLYIIRPDGYIAFIRSDQNLEKLNVMLES